MMNHTNISRNIYVVVRTKKNYSTLDASFLITGLVNLVNQLHGRTGK